MDKPIVALEWDNAGLRLLDQRLLPREETYVLCRDSDAVADAIRSMVVRGAPAIGVAAAYGVVLAVREARRRFGDDWRSGVDEPLARLARARPTAVNLAWAVERMRAEFPRVGVDPETHILQMAQALQRDNEHADRLMAAAGAELIPFGSRVITHCNTGTLATGGSGTALGIVRAAYAAGRIEHVYACEARPWLQGARLTMWELQRSGIPATLIIDSAAAFLMQRERISWVVVGADRIVANGDVANKIGTYNLAVAARAHGVKFMVAAPTSTVDLATAEGGGIRIELRDADEVRRVAGQLVAPEQVTVWNPVFDVTPAALIDAIVTERGVSLAPYTASLAATATC